MSILDGIFQRRQKQAADAQTEYASIMRRAASGKPLSAKETARMEQLIDELHLTAEVVTEHEQIFADEFRLLSGGTDTATADAAAAAAAKKLADVQTVEARVVLESQQRVTAEWEKSTAAQAIADGAAGTVQALLKLRRKHRILLSPPRENLKRYIGPLGVPIRDSDWVKIAEDGAPIAPPTPPAPDLPVVELTRPAEVLDLYDFLIVRHESQTPERFRMLCDQVRAFYAAVPQNAPAFEGAE